MTRTEVRDARVLVDDAIDALETVSRTFGGHRHHTTRGLCDLGRVDALQPFSRGETVKLASGRRGTFRGMVGARGGALVAVPGSGKLVVPVRTLARP
jgi:hypothetical protein